jgi:hypothetical protein
MGSNDQLYVPVDLPLAEEPPQLLPEVECKEVYVELLWK